jgi:hypothetical protein
MIPWTVLEVAIRADRIVREWDVVVAWNNTQCLKEVTAPRSQSQVYLVVQLHVFEKVHNISQLGGRNGRIASSAPVHSNAGGGSGIVQER